LQASFYRVLSPKSSVFCCSSCSSVDSPAGFFSLARARNHSKLRSCFRLCRAGCVSSSSLRRSVRSLLCFGSLRLVRSSCFSAVGWSVYSIAGFGFATFFVRPWLLFCLALQSCVRFSSASDAPCTQESQVPSWLSSLLSSL
jgi:hypothetical protein